MSETGREFKRAAFVKDVRNFGERNADRKQVMLLGCRKCGYIERRLDLTEGPKSERSVQ
jgi:hypothetical protein